MHRFYPQEILDYIRDNEHADVLELMLKSSPFPAYDMKEIVLQIKGRQIAKSKYPFILNHEQYRYPSKLSLEQSSSEVTARYKAGLMKGERFCDLTGGMGIDTYIIGSHFDKTTYVEPDDELCENAERNFRILGLNDFQIEHKTAEVYLSENNETFDWMYIDPSRRDQGRKKVDIDTLQPNVIEIYDLLLNQSNNVMIKLSPMQDVRSLLEYLVDIKKIYYISVGGEMKEILVHLSEGSRMPTHHCVVLPEGKEYIFQEEDKAYQAPLSDVMRYVYLPDPVFLKSQFQDNLVTDLDLYKLHPFTHIYTSEVISEGFPGRTYEVIKKVPLQKKKISPFLTDGKLNIIVKNFPMSPDQIKKKLKVKDGGDLYLIAYTDHLEEKYTLICKKL